MNKNFPSTEISFSKDGYLRLLKTVMENKYSILPMREAHRCSDPAMILRHDVDFSIDLALEMARIEHHLGIRSTFFFMTTCDYYNVFSAHGRSALIEINSLGHEVGLHWDSNFLPENKDDQADFFKAQLRMLSSVTGQEVLSASQHIPTDTPIFDISPFVKINAYSKSVNDRYGYVSDSSMSWRQYTPLDFLAKKVSFQFLAHPIWWMADGSTQAEKINFFMTTLCNQKIELANSYLLYMNKVLDSRDLYDERFRTVQGSV